MPEHGPRAFEAVDLSEIGCGIVPELVRRPFWDASQFAGSGNRSGVAGSLISLSGSPLGSFLSLSLGLTRGHWGFASCSLQAVSGVFSKVRTKEVSIVIRRCHVRTQDLLTFGADEDEPLASMMRCLVRFGPIFPHRTRNIDIAGSNDADFTGTHAGA